MRDYCDAQAGFWLNSKFWSKFSRKPLSGIEDQKAPPPPFISENFRFGMTKVYSGIPHSPPISENFRFGMTKVYSGIPLPNENCRRVQVREFQNTESYYMWRLYPTRITTSFLKLKPWRKWSEKAFKSVRRCTEQMTLTERTVEWSCH